MRLTAELRNRIYLDILPNRTLMTILNGCRIFHKAEILLLHLFRTIRFEVILIIFGRPRFCFDLTLQVNYVRAK